MFAAADRPDRAADAERALQQPRHAAHDRWQHAPVEQERRQHAHDQDDRQRLKCQDEIRARRLEVEWERAAADVAEHERGAGARCRRDRVDGVVDGAERLCHRRQFQQHQRGDDGDGKPDRGLPQRNRAAVLAERPRDRQQRQHAERRLQLQHESPEAPAHDYASGGADVKTRRVSRTRRGMKWRDAELGPILPGAKWAPARQRSTSCRTASGARELVNCGH